MLKVKLAVFPGLPELSLPSAPEPGEKVTELDARAAAVLLGIGEAVDSVRAEKK